MTAKQHTLLLRRLTREYNAALAAEEAAPTVEQAWRRAAHSERCLHRLRLVQAGLPLPVPQVPRTARNLARGGFAALALVGRVVARAMAREAALVRARAAAAVARAVRAAARVVRTTLRRAVGAVVALLPLVSTPALATTLKDTAMAQHRNDLTQIPAAACPRCGGWTSYGGCSQYARSTEPVHGRTGCPGPNCAPLPATLNGSPVRAFRPRDGGGFVVLVEHYGFQPWVTAIWRPSYGSTWEHGNYHADEQRAREDFRSR